MLTKLFILCSIIQIELPFPVLIGPLYMCVCACLYVCNVYMYVEISLIRKHILLLYTRVDTH